MLFWRRSNWKDPENRRRPTKYRGHLMAGSARAEVESRGLATPTYSAELLLSTAVDVPLDPPPLVVCGVDHASLLGPALNLQPFAPPRHDQDDPTTIP